MKKILICLFTLQASIAFSQDYKIVGDFTTNRTYQFTIKRGKIDSRQPITKDLAQLTQVEASFTQSDEYLRCIWKYGETIAVGPDSIVSQIGPEFYDLFNLYRGVEIELLFDPKDGGIDLVNYEMMKESIRSVFLKMAKNNKTKIDSIEINQVIKRLEPTYSTPEILLATYFPEINLYFGLYGEKFILGKSVKNENLYPNPFGGEAFPIVGVIGIDSVTNDLLIVKYTEEVKKEDVKRILKDMIRNNSKSANSQEKKEEIPEFSVNSEAEYHYDRENKRITRASTVKRIESSGVTQNVILVVTLLVM